MTDNTWPDPARPGVPANPERDGWHWLHHPEDLRPMVTPWNAEFQGWPSGALHSPQGVVDLGFRYLGPCLTPDQVAAAVAAEREACAEIARHVPIPEQASAWEAHGRLSAAMECAIAIRARGPADALAEAFYAGPRPMPDAARALADCMFKEEDNG